jgi:radical SAM protein (TIGR01212 family)
MYDSALIDDSIAGIIIATRPDCINKTILDIISQYKKNYDVWIELGLQSSNNDSLKWLNRGHSSEDFVKANKMCLDYGIKTTAHIIAGLPCETKKQMIETAEFVSDNKCSGIKIHSLYIIRNTALADLYYKENFQLLTLEEYAEIVAEMLGIINPDMVVHRITGETDADKIIAPDWVKNKMKVINLIHALLRQRTDYRISEFTN